MYLQTLSWIDSFLFLQLHSDQDKGDGSLKYILSGDGAGTLFIIDEKTGDIHATRRIDREEKAFYTLRAQAINRRTLRPVEPESEFVIKIHDINDNEPTFPEEIYTASVPEMSVVGKFIYNSYHGIQKVLKHQEILKIL